MNNNIISLHRYATKEGQMIAITFPMKEPFKTLVKQLNSRRWCDVHKWVYVENTPDNLREIYNKFKGLARIDTKDFYTRAISCRTKHGIVKLIHCAHSKKIFIDLPTDAKPEWTEKLKSFESSYYIKDTSQWTIPSGNENYCRIKEYFIAQGCMLTIKNINRSKIHKKPAINKWYYGKPIDLNYMREYKNMLILKRSKPNTAKCYISMFTRFLAYFYSKKISELSKTEIISYMLWEINQNGISATVQNQLINAIKYYYEKVLGNPREIYNLPRPKITKNEPLVLNKIEVQNILTEINNIKHKCIISLIFSAGLRRSELLNLKVNDIDLERKTVFIYKGKGGKDRISILAETTIRYINEYLKQYRPKYWLFEGQKGGQYSAESIWKIFNRLKKRCCVNKKGNVHLLRHTFATYLLESGTDIRYIQKLLGHSSIKTTEIYTHIANNDLVKIKSPIDDLGI